MPQDLKNSNHPIMLYYVAITVYMVYLLDLPSFLSSIFYFVLFFSLFEDVHDVCHCLRTSYDKLSQVLLVRTIQLPSTTSATLRGPKLATTTASSTSINSNSNATRSPSDTTPSAAGSGLKKNTLNNTRSSTLPEGF